MAQALALAMQGRGAVEPNPMVGCVVVRDGEIVGQGFHEHFGGPHAEINALAEAGELANGATLYVTLEPCCHQGKTPPCTQAIIAAGITRVIAAVQDPFAEVAGRGIAELKAAGIQLRNWYALPRRKLDTRTVSQIARNGPPMGDREMGDDARRQAGDTHRQQPVDFQRSFAGRGASATWPSRCSDRRQRHGPRG